VTPLPVSPRFPFTPLPFQLRFSIIGWYRKQAQLPDETTTSEAGYWLVGRDYLATSSTRAVGAWDGWVTFGLPGADQTGAVTVPYFARTAFRSTLSATGVLLHSNASVVVVGY
jgi:hypothetical protein